MPPGIAEVVPAVAGYARRIAKIDFMLAARLASVARLNTADGRKPYAARRPRSDAPAIPQARIGAKTQRAASHGLRVLRPALPRSSAQIIPFPVQPAASSDVAKAIAKAA